MKIIRWVGALLVTAIGIIDIMIIHRWITEWIKNPKWTHNPNSSLPLIDVSVSLIAIGFLIVIAVIAHKTGEKRISINYIKHVCTFYSTVFSKNFTEALIGLVGQVILSFIYFYDPEKFIYFVIYTLVFSTFWAAPVITGLANLEEIYVKAFNNKLTRCLQRMKEHYIVIGYGRFGKTVINDLFENYGCLKGTDADEEGSPILRLKSMLNERYKDVLFCTNLVIVDKDEKLLRNVFTHPHLGKIGVVILKKLNCLRDDKENHNKEVYIPAIVDDAKNKSIIDLARIGESKMVLSLIPEEEAALHLFNIINEKQPGKKGIITDITTRRERLLISQSYNTNIGFLHKYRMMGWALGNIVAAHLIGMKDKKNAKVLILGSGRQLHFLLEKIWLETPWKNSGISAKDFLMNNCLIIGNDEYINYSTITIGGYTYWNHELAYVTNSAVYEKDEEDYKMLVPYLKGISDEPTLLGPIISGTVPFYQKPFNRVNPKFFKKKPEIIIISSDSDEEILKAFNEVNSISRKHKLTPKPAIVVESNPGIQEVVMELNRRVYTGACYPGTKYPTPFLNEPYLKGFSENIINFFKDGNKMVRGYMEAMTGQDGVILRACVEDKPSVFAKFCFLLANLRVTNLDTCIPEHSSVPSFHNIQALTQRRKYFCFFSDADLIEIKEIKTSEKLNKLPDGLKFPDDLPEELKGKIHYDEPQQCLILRGIMSNEEKNKLLSLLPIDELYKKAIEALYTVFKIEDNTNHIREVFVSSSKQKNKEWLINKNFSLIPKDSGPQQIRGACMDLTSCPVCSFRKSIDAEPDPTTESDMKKARWKNPKDEGIKGSSVSKIPIYDNFARIYACGKGGDASRVLAMLLYKFMLYKGDGSNIDFKDPRPGQLVLNLKYIMNVECYNPDFELLRIYGNLEPWKKEDLKKLYTECLQGIVISPVTFKKEWWKYSKNLKGKLKLVLPLLYYDGKKGEPNNILIITKKYRDILRSEYEQFNKGKSVSDNFETSEKLVRLPDEVKFPEDLRNKIRYDDPNDNPKQRLIFKGIMSEEGKNKLLSLSEDDPYKKAIEALFQRTHFIPSEQQHGCPCPITECQFKSKAIYLIENGTKL
ncbi:MAG: hypothetical protein ACUZ77_02720 [Candidatus Brocadiales bacterium]